MSKRRERDLAAAFIADVLGPDRLVTEAVPAASGKSAFTKVSIASIKPRGSAHVKPAAVRVAAGDREGRRTFAEHGDWYARNLSRDRHGVCRAYTDAEEDGVFSGKALIVTPINYAEGEADISDRGFATFVLPKDA